MSKTEGICEALISVVSIYFSLRILCKPNDNNIRRFCLVNERRVHIKQPSRYDCRNIGVMFKNSYR